jgi:hypothetical protein
MRTILFAFAMLALAACESIPGVSGIPSGFTEERMAEGRYRIAYVPPDNATAKKVADRMLARAAQLTLDKGQEWFEIASKIDGKVEGKPTQTLVIVMGKGETLAGGPKQYYAKDTLASLKDRIS